MKKPICFAAIAIALTTAVWIWAAPGIPPAATAAIETSHDGHDHAPEKTPSGEEVHERLDHKNHGPIEDHKGHADEAETASRAGHGDEAEASAHTGHGHGAPGGICPEHRVAEEEDALCNSDRIARLEPGQGLMVRLGAGDVADRAGIRLSAPEPVSAALGTAVPGRVAFNRNRLAVISPLASGMVRRVYVQPGARVEKGQVLADVAMPEMAALKAQLIASRAKHSQTEAAYLREKDLLERGITSRQEFQQAESDYRAATGAAEQFRQQMLNYGLSPERVRELLQTGDSSPLVPLRAPFDGTIVEVKTAVGEAAAPGAALFTLADLDVLWIELSLPESRIYQARVGAPVRAGFAGLPGRAFTGRIFQVGAAVDERTRTLTALAEVKNPEHRLKVGMFGQVRLLEGETSNALAVAADALQSIDGFSFVFVSQEPDLFELRRVQAGEKRDGRVTILAGLSAGDQVVTTQGFALKSEVLKARLGASCADH